MKQKEKKELIEVISGLLMIAISVILFVRKVRVQSDFLTGEGNWEIWKQILVILPLVVGIIMMILKPRSYISSLIALVGVLAIVIVLIVDITFIVKKKISVFECILYAIMFFGGLCICVKALFINNIKRHKNEKR